MSSGRLVAPLGSLHARWVHARGVEVLAAMLAELIPPGAQVLDIGCADGHIAWQMQQKQPSITVRGLEIGERPQCWIPYELFDGQRIPKEDASVDCCVFVDPLHHTDDIAALLREAARVSRRNVLVKDHLCESRLDFATLWLMVWVGNRPHGVAVPHNYQSRRQWAAMFPSCGLRVETWRGQTPFYPFPFSMLFGRGLHFIAHVRAEIGAAGASAASIPPVIHISRDYVAFALRDNYPTDGA